MNSSSGSSYPLQQLLDAASLDYYYIPDTSQPPWKWPSCDLTRYLAQEQDRDNAILSNDTKQAIDNLEKTMTRIRNMRGLPDIDDTVEEKILNILNDNYNAVTFEREFTESYENLWKQLQGVQNLLTRDMADCTIREQAILATGSGHSSVLHDDSTQAKFSRKLDFIHTMSKQLWSDFFLLSRQARQTHPSSIN